MNQFEENITMSFSRSSFSFLEYSASKTVSPAYRTSLLDFGIVRLQRVFAVKVGAQNDVWDDGCIKDKYKGRGEREILPGVAVGCRGWAVVLLASRAYGAHKRNLHLRATPALSLHPEKARNKRNEFYAVERRDKVQASPRRRVVQLCLRDIAKFIIVLLFWPALLSLWKHVITYFRFSFIEISSKKKPTED